MKKGLLTIILLTLVFNLTGLKAQDVLNGVYLPEHITDKKQVPYQFLREADVMWSKTVWRFIELTEKVNLPMYYPLTPIGNRKSLMDVLMSSIQFEGLTAYQENSGDEFGTILTIKDIEDRFGVKTDTVWIDNLEDPDGPKIPRVQIGEIHTYEVKRILVKEVWFFDKQRSVLEVRIIGLCPILNMRRENPQDPDDFEIIPKRLFWIYYPEARKSLAKYPVFNELNEAEGRSFDDIFAKRLFSSYIIQESNVYGNRIIMDYATGLDAMLEADRIKESIFNYEQDLWEY